MLWCRKIFKALPFLCSSRSSFMYVVFRGCFARDNFAEDHAQQYVVQHQVRRLATTHFDIPTNNHAHEAETVACVSE